jgi:hypothetical protein
MTVEAIRAAIGDLNEQERRELADWFGQLEADSWDAEMEQDLAPGGRGHHLVEKINQQIDDGKFTPMEKGLRPRQEQ